MAHHQEIKTEEFAKIIFEAVYEERYLNKEILVSKIKTLAKLYRLRISSDNFNSIENPTKTANLMQTVKKVDYERKFWLDKIKSKVDPNEMNEFFEQLENELRQVNFK